MNILLCYRWSPYTSAAYYAKAFRALGQDVKTWGTCAPSIPWRLIERGQKYKLTGSHDAWAQDYTFSGPVRMHLGPWKPDVYVWIEAGAGWRPVDLPGDIPTIGYFIDSHTQLSWHKDAARRYDHVFVADIRYVAEYGPNAHWLPMACDPDVHTPTVMPDEPEYDVAFVGNTYPGSPMYEDRRQTLDMLGERYKCNFVQGAYFEDMANVYASARVAFNKSVLGDLNMRVFEAMCSGRPVVTDGVEGLDACSVGILPYRDDADACACIDLLLARQKEADLLGALARQNVLAHHTYAHRAAQMLAEAGL